MFWQVFYCLKPDALFDFSAGLKACFKTDQVRFQVWSGRCFRHVYLSGSRKYIMMA